MQGSWGAIILSTLVGVVGCGGDASSSSPGGGDPGGAGGGVGGTGSPSPAGGAAGSGLAGGNAPSGGSVSNATGGRGGAGKSCQGSYGAPQPLFAESATFSINGPSVTADELQVFYSRAEVAFPEAPDLIVYRQRSSLTQAFGSAQPMPELADACKPDQRVNPDISEDGLTLYVTCTNRVDSGSEGSSPLRVARRSSTSDSFVLDVSSAGSVLASAGLSADELTAYTSGETWDTAPHMFKRPSKSASFSKDEAVPGITETLNSPDISADGLTLFGSAPAQASGKHSAIRRAMRDDVTRDFGPLTELDLGASELTLGAPNVTPSCSLYLVVVNQDGPRSVQVSRPE